jgi:hypothetical protein
VAAKKFAAHTPSLDMSTKLYGISRLDASKLKAAATATKKQVAKTKILTPERKALEKKAHELTVASHLAEKVERSRIGKLKGDELWAVPPKKRMVNFAGFFANFLGTPSDAILAIAAGAQPGPPMMEGEMRKTILGGLMALHESGKSDFDPKGLNAPLVGNKTINAKLAEAAGAKGKSLQEAYDLMVKKIDKAGPEMKSLAWGYRQQLWLKDVAGIEAVHSMAGAITAMFVPIGTIVGAAIGGHSAITMALAQSLAVKAEAAVQQSLEALGQKQKAALMRQEAAAAEQQADLAIKASQLEASLSPAGAEPWYKSKAVLIGGGVILTLAVVAGVQAARRK